MGKPMAVKVPLTPAERDLATSCYPLIIKILREQFPRSNVPDIAYDYAVNTLLRSAQLYDPVRFPAVKFAAFVGQRVRMALQGARQVIARDTARLLSVDYADPVYAGLPATPADETYLTRDELQQILGKLSASSRWILTEYYLNNKWLHEIAETSNPSITRQRASHVLRRAIAEARESLGVKRNDN